MTAVELPKPARATRGFPRVHWLLGATGLIVIGASGCDNVEWGGSTMSLSPPPSSSDTLLAPSAPATPEAPSLPPGSLLFAATAQGDATYLTALAFVEPGGVMPVPRLDDPRVGGLLRRHLEGLDALTLLRAGTRVGTFIPGDPAMDVDPLCPSQARLVGRGEYRQDLESFSGLVALPTSEAVSAHGDLATPPPIRDVRASTLTMAGAQITEVGAVWPPSLMAIRRDIQLFYGDGGVGVAASFLYRDRLDLATAPAGSYSIFVMGEQAGEEVVPTYGHFRRAGTDGKWAPRLLSTLDWDEDGEDEAVLEMLGEGVRGFRLLDRTPAGFVDVLEIDCGPVVG